MSLAIVYSRASMGVQAPLVTIEVHLSNGKPGFTLVGLPEKTVKEAQDRVRSALMNAQFKYPSQTHYRESRTSRFTERRRTI